MLRTTRRALVLVGLLGVIARALVPVGLMPAPASAGGPFVFCHGGGAGAFFRALAASERPAGAHEHASADQAPAHAGHHGEQHAGHHTGLDQAASAPSEFAAGTPLDGPKTDHLAWETCAFAAAFAHAVPAPVLELPLLALEHTRALPVPRVHTTTATAHRYWARGPPLRTT